jgi:hypothetical protein
MTIPVLAYLTDASRQRGTRASRATIFEVFDASIRRRGSGGDAGLRYGGGKKSDGIRALLKSYGAS